MYFHVLVEPREVPTHILPRLWIHDLDEETLLATVVRPYEEGEHLSHGGLTIRNEEVRRVLITHSETPAQSLREQAIARRPRFGRIVDDEELMVRCADDVTSEYITGPPGFAARSRQHAQRAKAVDDPRRVMVVHGRNDRARSAMFQYLRALGLSPVDWEDAVAATGKGSPQNFEAAKAAIESAQATVVVMTAEDEARLHPELVTASDGERERALRGQPRPNVLIEAGLVMGVDDTHTILVEVGPLRTASDFDGLNKVRIGNDPKSRASLRRRLSTSGCPVSEAAAYLDPSESGDFEAAILVDGLTDGGSEARGHARRNHLPRAADIPK